MRISNRPPFAGDERSQIVGWLDHQRDLVRMKCEGLKETDAHRAVLPSSPLMTMAGVVAAASVRWILLHMIEETSRHLGHLDAIRELLDGTTSYETAPTAEAPAI